MRKVVSKAIRNWLGVLLLLLSPPTNGNPPVETLAVYTSDSFSTKGSLGEVAKERFEKKFGAKVNYVSFPSVGEALNQIAFEGKVTTADVLVGVDNSLLSRAKKLEAFVPFNQATGGGISNDFIFDKDRQFLPYDYGYLTLVYDIQRVSGVPRALSLKGFAKSGAFKKRVVIEDPRTSSIGLGFLIYTRTVFGGTEFDEFWKNFASLLISISPGWSGAYGMFLKKEADFVLSYTTSPAYHIEKENKHNILAMAFSEGHYRQIEGAGVVKYSKKISLARKYVELLLSDDVQNEVATHNWMYPVKKGARLPRSFAELPKITKAVDVDPNIIESSKREWVRSWALLMSR